MSAGLSIAERFLLCFLNSLIFDSSRFFSTLFPNRELQHLTDVSQLGILFSDFFLTISWLVRCLLAHCIADLFRLFSSFFLNFRQKLLDQSKDGWKKRRQDLSQDAKAVISTTSRTSIHDRLQDLNTSQTAWQARTPDTRDHEVGWFILREGP